MVALNSTPGMEGLCRRRSNPAFMSLRDGLGGQILFIDSEDFL